MDIVTENVRSILSLGASIEAFCAVTIVAITGTLLGFRLKSLRGFDSMGRQYQPAHSSGRSRQYPSTYGQVEDSSLSAMPLVDGLRNQLRLFLHSN